MSPDAGIPGDAWDRGQVKNPEAQLTVMQADVARLIANDQPLTLFGDNLFLNLDLSVQNLPVGSRVQVGGAILEVTPMPHNGCRKFQARFGQAAHLRHSGAARIFSGYYLLRTDEGNELCVTFSGRRQRPILGHILESGHSGPQQQQAD